MKHGGKLLEINLEYFPMGLTTKHRQPAQSKFSKRRRYLQVAQSHIPILCVINAHWNQNHTESYLQRVTTEMNTFMMNHPQKNLFLRKKIYLIAPFQMHAEVQYLCPVTWNIFLGNLHVKIRVHGDKLKIFPTRHQRPIRDWGTHRGGWICVHKNYQGNVSTESGSHYILQPAHFAHVTARLLSSAFQNWTLGTQ